MCVYCWVCDAPFRGTPPAAFLEALFILLGVSTGDFRLRSITHFLRYAEIVIFLFNRLREVQVGLGLGSERGS